MSETTTPLVPVGEGGGVLRDLDFADPLSGMTAERYEEMIRGHARESGSQERFVATMLQVLRGDLVDAHPRDPVAAEEGIEEFAERVWAEEHP